MHDVLIIPKTIYDLVALVLVGLGYVFKGVIFATLGELVYKPTAKYLISKGQEWEHTHPFWYKTLVHYFEAHSGLHHTCDKCSPSQ